MVEKIVGYDKNKKIVFERQAREYDKSIGYTILGVSVGDLVKAIPVIFVAGMIYMHQQNFDEQILGMVNNNSKAIEDMGRTLNHLNNSLSVITGKQFDDGEPK